MIRLCEECGYPTGPRYYVVEWYPDVFYAEPVEKVVCAVCSEEPEFEIKREVTETPEQLAIMERKISDMFPPA